MLICSYCIGYSSKKCGGGGNAYFRTGVNRLVKMVQGGEIGKKTVQVSLSQKLNAVINPDFCSRGKKNPILVQCGLVQGLGGTRKVLVNPSHFLM